MQLSSRAAFVLLLGASILGCGGRSGPPQQAPPPANILMLVVDCLRADRVGAATPYGRAVAPRLEALAAAGTRFTRAFAQASWTRPSVPTMLTGLYPSEHGLGAFLQEGDEVMGGSLSPAAVTVAEALRALGYATALFAQQNQLAPKFGLDQGFDVYDHKASKARAHPRGAAGLARGRAQAAVLRLPPLPRAALALLCAAGDARRLHRRLPGPPAVRRLASPARGDPIGRGDAHPRRGRRHARAVRRGAARARRRDRSVVRSAARARAVGRHADRRHRGPWRGVLRARRHGPWHQPLRRADPRADGAQAAGELAHGGRRRR